MSARDVTVTPIPDGPLLVRGADTVVDEHGDAHAVTRPVVGVCACGMSQRAPWCDGTHKFGRAGGRQASRGSEAAPPE